MIELTGGSGSGNRCHYGAKPTTHDYRTLDVRQFARAGVLRSGYWGGWAMDTRWRGCCINPGASGARPDRPHVQTPLQRRRMEGRGLPRLHRLHAVQCRGSRAWFICPAAGCGRRVANLYGGDIFASRHCYQLAYASSREDAAGRAMRRADRLRARLGWGEPGILNGEGDKPKWMRWGTFERLATKHDELLQPSIQGMMRRFA
jgi:hypothetical protein